MLDRDALTQEEIDTQEEIMEYLSRSITREKGVSLKIQDVPTSYAMLDDKEIVLQMNVEEAEDEEMLKRFWKAFNLHESAHISWSGSLEKEYKSWMKKDGNFEDFKDTINAVEDVRIENTMTKVLPQTRKYFVEFLEKFLEKRGKEGVLHTNNLIMALRIALENKIELPYHIDEKAQPYLDEAIEKFNEYDVLNGNWKNVVDCCREIHKIFNKARKEHPEEFGGSEGEIMEHIKGIDGELGKLDGEFTELRDETEAIEIEIEVIEEKLEETTDKDEGKGLKAKKEDLKEKKEKVEDELEENSGKTKELSKKRETEMRKVTIAREKRKKEKTVEGLIRRTEFETRKDDGEFADKTTDEIVEELREASERLESDPEAEETPFGDMERYGELPVPKVEEFGKDTFRNSTSIPEVELAIETGNEMASALKRVLNLKKSLIKRKTSGKLDMRRVRKQFTYYGKIRDTDIFQRGRYNLPDHSVLVLIDFSGSMGGSKLRNAKQAMATLGRTLAQLRINHSLRGYCAEDGRIKIGDVVLKDFDKEELDYKALDHAFHPNLRGSRYWGQNRDGDSWRYGAELLTHQTGDKLLIVISDGEPCHGGTSYTGRIGEEDSKLAVDQIETMGIKCIGISIDQYANDYIEDTFKNSFFFDNEKLKDLGEGLTEIYLETMKFG